ncbi:MAG: substrate-binding periplasmic protein [Planctomycetota bacterium]
MKRGRSRGILALIVGASVLLAWSFGLAQDTPPSEKSAAPERPVDAGARTITLNVDPNGFPPYLIHSEDGGIMVEVLRELARREGIKVHAIAVPRKRTLAFLEAGELDVNPQAREWVRDPERFAWSDVVLVARDVIFSRADDPVAFEEAEDLFGTTLGAPRGYRYPALDAHFEAGRILRDDGPHEESLLRKVLKRRNRAAIVNEAVGRWLIREHGWAGKLVWSESDLGSFDYRFMFPKRHAAVAERLNVHLRALKAEGVIDAIIDRYR